MKKTPAKYSFKEIIAIVISWLFAIAILYVVWLKIKMFYA